MSFNTIKTLKEIKTDIPYKKWNYAYQIPFGFINAKNSGIMKMHAIAGQYAVDVVRTTQTTLQMSARTFCKWKPPSLWKDL